MLLAVRNEAKALANTLDSLVNQDLPSDQIEVLVIDGESTDKTVSIALGFKDRLPYLRVISNPRLLAAAGWNLGLLEATAPVVCILSGHAKLPEDFFQRILPQLTPQRAGVGGVAIPVGTDARSSIIAAAFSSRLGNGGASFMQASKPGPVETIAFGCYWRDELLELGGFDEAIVRGQDWDLNLRLRLLGKTLWLDPSLRIEYTTRNDYVALWHRQFRAGYWKPFIHWKNAAPFLWRHWIPGFFVASIISMVLLGAMWKPAWIACVSLIGLHILASTWVAGRLNLKLFEKIQFWWAIWIIHFAYGLGFWGGIAMCLKMAMKRKMPRLNS